MGLFTGTFEAETGTVELEIDGSSTVSGSGTFYVHDIGKLEFSNELPNKDSEAPSEVITKQGGLTVKVRDTLTNGNSLFGYLKELQINEQLNATLTVNALDTFMALDYRSVKYSAKDEMVEMTFKPRYDFGLSTGIYGTTGANNEIGVNYLRTTYAPTADVYPSEFQDNWDFHKFIQTYLNYVYGTGATTYIKSSTRATSLSPSGFLIQPVPAASSISDGDDYVLVADFNNGSMATLTRFAALEGSFFGNAFNTSYYIHRLYNGSDATGTFRPEINYSNIEDLVDFQEKSDIRTMALTMYTGPALGTGGTYATSSYSTSLLNTEGTQEFTAKFNSVAAFPSSYSTGSAWFVGSSGMAKTVLDSGLPAYAKALNADGSKRISFKFRNALSLKPYQCFTLSSGTPAVFRASGASSVVYRPSRLFYDFKGDYVEGEAYAIGAI